MDTYLFMPEGEQRGLLEQAAAEFGIAPVSVEKDYWMCWILRELAQLPEWSSHFTFKGGTSLSKAWKLIQRFSEDLDIVIDQKYLGFSGEEAPEKSPSRKQQEKRLKTLKAVCKERINEDLFPGLEAQIAIRLRDVHPWSLARAPIEEDPDNQTLLFHYPSVYAGSGGYVRPVVKIELGARSDTEPNGMPAIQSYLAEALHGFFRDSSFTIRTVTAERTCWEKTMLLHEETFRPPDKPRRGRLARHYYDLWCLILHGVADRALADQTLFERVLAHRRVFFRINWIDYSTYRPGSFRIIPHTEQLEVWRADYRSMREEMIFGDAPGFDEILEVISGFENRCNT